MALGVRCIGITFTTTLSNTTVLQNIEERAAEVFAFWNSDKIDQCAIVGGLCLK